MRYVRAKLEEELRVVTYRIFVTDYLKGIGRFDGERYIDSVKSALKPVETRSSDEIIDNIRSKLSRLGGD